MREEPKNPFVCFLGVGEDGEGFVYVFFSFQLSLVKRMKDKTPPGFSRHFDRESAVNPVNAAVWVAQSCPAHRLMGGLLILSGVLQIRHFGIDDFPWILFFDQLLAGTTREFNRSLT